MKFCQSNSIHLLYSHLQQNWCQFKSKFGATVFLSLSARSGTKLIVNTSEIVFPLHRISAPMDHHPNHPPTSPTRKHTPPLTTHPQPLTHTTPNHPPTTPTINLQHPHPNPILFPTTTTNYPSIIPYLLLSFLLPSFLPPFIHLSVYPQIVMMSGLLVRELMAPIYWDPQHFIFLSSLLPSFWFDMKEDAEIYINCYISQIPGLLVYLYFSSTGCSYLILLMCTESCRSWMYNTWLFIEAHRHYIALNEAVATIHVGSVSWPAAW